MVSYRDKDTVQNRLGHSVFLAGLHHDAIDIAVLHLGADVRTCQTCADGIKYCLGRDTHALAGYLVNVELILRIVGRIRSHRHQNLWPLLQLLCELGRQVDEGFIVVARSVLEVQLY